MKNNKDLKDIEEKLDKLKTAKTAAFIVSCLLIMSLASIPLAVLKWVLIVLSIAGALTSQVVLIKEISKAENLIKNLKKIQEQTAFVSTQKERSVENVVKTEHNKANTDTKNNLNDTDFTL